MRNQIAFVLVLVACSATPIEIEAEPIEGRPLNQDEYIQLVAAYASNPNLVTCPGGEPEVCARRVVEFADALAAEVRRSDNWP
jgi:hypothetical protein